MWWRVQRYAPELEERTRLHLKPTNKSWRVDETYVRIKGHWFYLYRAIDSAGATLDFLLLTVHSADAAKQLFSKALTDPSHLQPRAINTDKAKCKDYGKVNNETSRTKDAACSMVVLA